MVRVLLRLTTGPVLLFPSSDAESREALRRCKPRSIALRVDSLPRALILISEARAPDTYEGAAQEFLIEMVVETRRVVLLLEDQIEARVAQGKQQ